MKDPKAIGEACCEHMGKMVDPMARAKSHAVDLESMRPEHRAMHARVRGHMRDVQIEREGAKL